MDISQQIDPPANEPRALLELDADTREAGRAAGFDWAADEAQRGYLHPVILNDAPQLRILIDHAHTAFGGRCRGRRRAFIRGFVQGVADYWPSRSG